MKKPSLVVMAAGIGNRYGGLKQIDPIGPSGEIIIEYSIYDALKAGFGKVVFVIKKDIEEAFRERIGRRIERLTDTVYVYQNIETLPEGFTAPPGRNKPWGTAHAVMCCRDVVDTPFAVINADDFYGSTTFRSLYEYLGDLKDESSKLRYCMVGFKLKNTLTENGYVARGICSVDSDGYLNKIDERTRICKFADAVKYTEDGVNWIVIPENSIVSMNTWGFTPSLFSELENRFSQFLSDSKDNLLKSEYFLPTVVGSLISEDKARVKVLGSVERWYGVTYQEDKPVVRQAITDMVQRGLYPVALREGI